MLARAETIPTLVENWLAQFERALAAPDHALLRSLFHADSHWRDILALTRDIRASADRARPKGFRIDPERTPPAPVKRVGVDAIEAIFKFETAEGRGSGVLRLTADPDNRDQLKAWTLHTALNELKGHEETVGRARPHGTAYSRDFRGPNWLDLRRLDAEYRDRDPTVLIVGG